MLDSLIEKKLKILSAVTKLHQSIGVHLELGEVGAILVEALSDITNCEACAILLIEGDKVSILAERGFINSFGSINLSTDLPAIRQIIETKKPIFSNDLEKDGALAGCVPAGCRAKSLLCVPVLINNEVKGIIHLDSIEKNAFDEEDLNFVQVLAKETAIAIERSLLYEEIKNLSVTDTLTNLFNRRRMEEDLRNELERSKRYTRPLSILMIDIDHFKNYNDHHGHQKGDELLREIAKLLRRNLRAIDKVYRYGGEEFLVMLPEVDKEGALACAERLRKKTEQEPFEGEEQSQPSGKITISIGVASYPLDGDSIEKLIEAADSALYRAKALGRNRVCLY
ncbi:GGDEF domain-containing protein [bacterium]|nr:GGDEF domain-containing protein [bacterium]